MLTIARGKVPMFGTLKNKMVIWPASKVTIFAVLISLILTALMTFVSAENSSEFWNRLYIGLLIGSTVPLMVAFPVSYYVLLQHEKLKVLSIELEASNEKLEFLLKFDSLTSVLTRRAFFLAAELSLENLHNSNRTGAFCFLDVDHFKKVNDTFGHATGDEVLRILGKLINDHLQPGEIAGRLGGEEFGIFLPNCRPDKSFERAQLLIDDFKYAARSVNGKPVGATLSIGIATIYQSDTLDQLLNAADRMLYAAKERGRDRVVRDTERVIEKQNAAA